MLHLLACIFHGRLGKLQVHASIHAGLATPIYVLYFHIAGRIDGFVNFWSLRFGVIIDPICLGEQSVNLMLQVLELGDFTRHEDGAVKCVWLHVFLDQLVSIDLEVCLVDNPSDQLSCSISRDPLSDEILHLH